MAKKHCENCDNMVDELFIVNIECSFMSETNIICEEKVLCEDCISKLKHENLDYIILTKKG